MSDIIEISSSDEEDNDCHSLWEKCFEESHRRSDTASELKDQGSENLRMLVKCISDKEMDTSNSDDGDDKISIWNHTTLTKSGHVREGIESSSDSDLMETRGVDREGTELPSESYEPGGLVSEMCSIMEQEERILDSDDDDDYVSSVHSQNTICDAAHDEEECGLDESSCDSDFSLSDVMSPRKKQRTSAEGECSSDMRDSLNGIKCTERCGAGKESGMQSSEKAGDTGGRISGMCLMRELENTEKNWIESRFVERSATPPTQGRSHRVAALIPPSLENANEMEKTQFTGQKGLEGAVPSEPVHSRVPDSVTKDAAFSGLDEETLQPAKDRLVTLPVTTERSTEAVPGPNQQVQTSTNDNAYDDHDFYGLGKFVRKAVFSTFKIEKMHQWQRDMLQQHFQDSLGKKNVLVVAPTSGGKTLVAVIILLRSMLVDHKDTILALPYIAIVTEKVGQLQDLAGKLSTFTVMEYASSRGRFPIPAQKKSLRRMYIATFEKASGIWRNLCKEGERRSEIGTVVFDELHMISQGMRGTVIEGLIVSLLSMSCDAISLVALTATVGNPEELRTFLGGGDVGRCILYEVNARPVKIREQIVVSGTCVPIRRAADGRGSIDFNGDGRTLLEDADPLADTGMSMFHQDKDRAICRLVFEAMDREDPVLIFCTSRKSAVQYCATITKARLALYRENGGYSPDLQSQRSNLIGHLRQESKGMVDRALLDGITVGVGFHTAALHHTERRAVEDAFSRGTLLVLCCTSTLSTGVNLPAARVIIVSPQTWKGQALITCSSYLQQVGRAGRGLARGTAASDCEADSYLFLTADEVPKFENLLSCHVESVQSQMRNVVSHYKRSATKEMARTAKIQEFPFSGVTRVILSAMEVAGCSGISVEQILSLYRQTLVYQQGEVAEETGIRKWTLLPFITDLEMLLSEGHIQVTRPREVEDVPCVTVTVSNVIGPQPAMKSATSWIGPKPEELEGMALTDAELADFMNELKIAKGGSTANLKNYMLTVTTFTAAATAAFMSLDDAMRFVQEADQFEDNMSLKSMLTFLYLSITMEMSKGIRDCGPYIRREIFDKYDRHPHQRFLEQVGLYENKLGLWVRGSPGIRRDEDFTCTLTRMWSALFLNDLCCNPEQYETLCQRYGFDRGMTLELSSNLASRCYNIRVFCMTLERYWWYPQLAAKVAPDLIDAVKEELRPLLVIRHVTPERAKMLIKMGHKTVRDVALVTPATALCDRIKFLGQRQAEEMVRDARLLLSNEAVELDAESRDRREALSKDTR